MTVMTISQLYDIAPNGALSMLHDAMRYEGMFIQCEILQTLSDRFFDTDKIFALQCNATAEFLASRL